MTSLHGLTLTFTHRGRAILQHAVQWTDATGRTWTAQPGLLTDGGSIPAAAWPFVGHPFSGSALAAFVLHDAYCQSRTVSSWRVHRMLYDVLRAQRVSWVRARLIYTAVRWFGPRFPGTL